MNAEPDPYLVDDENPELTDEQIKAMRPASKVLPPDLYKKLVERYEARRAAREPVHFDLEGVAVCANSKSASQDALE